MRRVLKETRSAGLCLACRKFPHEPELTRCSECREKLAERDRIRASFVSKGICGRCNKKPVLPGTAKCGWCRKRLNAYQRKRRLHFRGKDRKDCALRIIDILYQSGPLDLYTIAERVCVSTRTALRHVQKLHASGSISYEVEGSGSKKIYEVSNV